jgi:hypothetical protein
MDTSTTDELNRLAGLARRLRPDWKNPESFYELRSEVVGGLHRLAQRAGQRASVIPPAPPSRPVPAPVTHRIINGFARTCAHCHRPFRTDWPAQKFCANTCRQAAYRLRRDARSKDGPPAAPGAPTPPRSRSRPRGFLGLGMEEGSRRPGLEIAYLYVPHR